MARDTAIAHTSAASAARRREAVGEANMLERILSQKCANRLARAQRAVQLRVGARLVGANAHQILRARINRHQLAHQRRLLAMLLSRHSGHQAADRIQHLDGRIPSLAASARDSTTCPSSSERTASTSGSCWSSPSINTV